jgi:hypothetical protein
MLPQLLLDARQRRGRRQAGEVQDAERGLHRPARGRIDPGAAHADHVDGARGGGHAQRHHERRDVPVHLRAAADVGERADAGERRDAGQLVYGGAVLDDDVSGESRIVDQDDMVADGAVMRDVARGHHEAVIADACVHALARRPVYGHVLADHGLVADPHADGHTVPVLEVLRDPADHGAMSDPAARPDRHPSFEHDVGADLRSFPDAHVRPDHRYGATHPPRTGARIDDGAGVNHPDRSPTYFFRRPSLSSS